MSEKWFYKEVDILIPVLVYLYNLKNNTEAVSELGGLLYLFMTNSIEPKYSDSYSLWEKVGEVASDPDNLSDSLSIMETPMHLVSLWYKEDSDTDIDNDFVKELPEIVPILTKLKKYASDNKDASEAIKIIESELRRANVVF